MPVGYVPDQFGHVGQLPQIFAGFGLSAAVLWRGVGADVEQHALPLGRRRTARELPTVWLIHGYGNGMHLPRRARGAGRAARARAARPGSRTAPCRCVLIMNGSDHLRAAARAAGARSRRRAPLLDGRATSRSARCRASWRACARRSAPAAAAACTGASCAPGCARRSSPAARRRGCRRSAPTSSTTACSTRYLEPLAAWWARSAAIRTSARSTLAWRIALENHPHDSICGCSIDAVHDADGDALRAASPTSPARTSRTCWRGSAARSRRAPGDGSRGRRVESARRRARRGGGRARAAARPARGAARGCALGAVRRRAGRAAPVHARGRGAGRALRELRAARVGVREPAARLPARVLRRARLRADARADEAGRACVDVWLGAARARRTSTGSASGAPRSPRSTRAATRPRCSARAGCRACACSCRATSPARGCARCACASAEPRATAASRARARRSSAQRGACVENERWRDRGRARRSRAPRAPADGSRAWTTRCGSSARRTAATATASIRCPAASGVERPERVSLRARAALRRLRRRSASTRCYRVPRVAGAGPPRAQRDARSSCRCASSSASSPAVDRARRRASRSTTRRATTGCACIVRAPFAAERFAVESAFEVAGAADRAGAGRFRQRAARRVPGRRHAAASLRAARGGRLALLRRQSRLGEVEALPGGGGGRAGADAGARGRLALARRSGAPARPRGSAARDAGRAVSRAATRRARALARRAATTRRAVADALRFADPPLALRGRRARRARLHDGARLARVGRPGRRSSARSSRARAASPGCGCSTHRTQLRSVQVRWNGPGALAQIDLRGRPLSPERAPPAPRALARAAALAARRAAGRLRDPADAGKDRHTPAR